MEYAVLGSTGRKVSRIGFGGAPAGIRNYLDVHDPENDRQRQDVVDAIRLAYRLGVNYFDTAADYGAGSSESMFGEGLKGIPPEEVFLATKVRVESGAYARSSLEQSLRRLGRESIDLIQIHGTVYDRERFDRVMDKGGELDELEKARDEGLVKYIGFTVECQNNALYDFIRSGRFDTMQVEYNLCFQHPYDPNWKCGSMYDAEAAGLGIITMRTLTSGVFQQWIRLANPGADFDYHAALLQFVLSNPLVDVALLGMRNEREVRANVDTWADTGGRLNLAGDVHHWYRDGADPSHSEERT